MCGVWPVFSVESFGRNEFFSVCTKIILHLRFTAFSGHCLLKFNHVLKLILKKLIMNENSLTVFKTAELALLRSSMDILVQQYCGCNDMIPWKSVSL